MNHFDSNTPKMVALEEKTELPGCFGKNRPFFFAKTSKFEDIDSNSIKNVWEMLLHFRYKHKNANCRLLWLPWIFFSKQMRWWRRHFVHMERLHSFHTRNLENIFPQSPRACEAIQNFLDIEDQSKTFSPTFFPHTDATNQHKSESVEALYRRYSWNHECFRLTRQKGRSYYHWRKLFWCRPNSHCREI